MSWFRTFIRRHLIADDPAPEYSRLDEHDGLKAASANTMPVVEESGVVEPYAASADTRGAILAAIEDRLTADENGCADGVVDQSVRDRRYLLALVRDQAASIGAVKALADSLETSADGDRHHAALIRAALTGTVFTGCIIRADGP